MDFSQAISFNFNSPLATVLDEEKKTIYTLICPMYQTLIRCKEMLASHDYILVVENISRFNYKVVRK